MAELGFEGHILKTEANDICKKYTSLFTKYALCHDLMNSSDYFDDKRITTLSKNLFIIIINLVFEKNPGGKTNKIS